METSVMISQPALAFSDYQAVMPEMFLLAMACLILIVDLFLSDEQRDITYRLTQFTLAGAVALILIFPSQGTTLAFFGSVVHDALSDLLKVVVTVITAGVFLYSRDYLRQRDLYKGEFFVLGLFGLIGMMVMISAASMLTLYLGLELLSLSMYAMVALDRDSKVASEAAMKYFILGALASGMLLYGISMLYGASGSLQLREVSAYVAWQGSEDLILVFGLVFVIVGLAFKLGTVPFHMWLPDVYQGAPTAVTAYLSGAPKVAAFAMFIRLLAEGADGLQAEWGDMLIILAVLSLALGNVVAIAQTNIKRMLAYSAISHAGFILLGVLAGTAIGYSAATFYATTYALMALAGFGMIILLSRKGFEADTLDDFKGLNERSPWLALMSMITMFSMAGVPPTVGFYAKLAVLDAIIRQDMVWLAGVAVFFSIIGAFYYIRVVKLVYFDKPNDVEPLQAPTDSRVAMSVNGLAILGLGIFPAGLMGLCVAAFA